MWMLPMYNNYVLNFSPNSYNKNKFRASQYHSSIEKKEARVV